MAILARLSTVLNASKGGRNKEGSARIIVRLHLPSYKQRTVVRVELITLFDIHASDRHGRFLVAALALLRGIVIRTHLKLKCSHSTALALATKESFSTSNQIILASADVISRGAVDVRRNIYVVVGDLDDVAPSYTRPSALSWSVILLKTALH